MFSHDIDVLNALTKTLIDNCDGYIICSNMADDNPALNSEFRRVRAEREALIAKFQSAVRSMGGEPEDDGCVSGAVHRGFTRFTALFPDDEAAAISALDDGEEYLAAKIEERLGDTKLKATTRELLHKALRSTVTVLVARSILCRHNTQRCF